MELYHSKVSPVKQILNLHGLPAIHAANDALVVPLSVDYGWWSEEADRLTTTIANYQPAGIISKRIIYVSGTISPVAKEQLAKRGLEVTDNVYTPLYR